MSSEKELEAFNRLFSYKEKFIRFAQSYVHDPALAEDYVIDALLYYWENRHKLDEDSNVPAYILTIVKHKCLDYLQHRKMREEVESRLLSDAQWELNTNIATLKAFEPYQIFTEETERLVRHALELLPERTREIFLMSRAQNLSHKEIAERLGISPKGVEFHIAKALKVLRAELKDYLPVFLYYLMLH